MQERHPMPVRRCCMQQCGYQLNPLDVKNTLLAGAACEICPIVTRPEVLPEFSQAMVVQECPEGNCLLATAYIADQQYVAGYCPNETFYQGTLFPELVRPYMK